MKSKNLSENILRSLKLSGFDYIDLDTVIPTNLILERSGESFRSLIFSFMDQNGKEICLLFLTFFQVVIVSNCLIIFMKFILILK